MISGGNVKFPSYETVFHATFNEALQECYDDLYCNFGDYNCATGEFLKYDYISSYDNPRGNNAN